MEENGRERKSKNSRPFFCAIFLIIYTDNTFFPFNGCNYNRSIILLFAYPEGVVGKRCAGCRRPIRMPACWACPPLRSAIWVTSAIWRTSFLMVRLRDEMKNVIQFCHYLGKENQGMSWLNSKERSWDQCVLCHCATSYTIDTRITKRSYYIEGTGQLCETCFRKIQLEERLTAAK